MKPYLDHCQNSMVDLSKAVVILALLAKKSKTNREHYRLNTKKVNFEPIWAQIAPNENLKTNIRI